MCADINECTRFKNGYCDAKTTCTNTIGSRTCSACPAGEPFNPSIAACCMDFSCAACALVCFRLPPGLGPSLRAARMRIGLDATERFRVALLHFDFSCLLFCVPCAPYTNAGYFGSGEFGCVNPKDAGTISVNLL